MKEGELTLEEILAMAHRVRKWEYSFRTDEAGYSGDFSPKGFFGPSVKIKVNKTHSEGNYKGSVYYRTDEFEDEELASLDGESAQKLFDEAEACCKKLHPRGVQMAQASLRYAEKSRKERKENKIEEMREYLSGEPEQIPWYRRMGR